MWGVATAAAVLALTTTSCADEVVRPAKSAAPTVTRTPTSEPEPTPTGPATSDGRPRNARLTIPAIDVDRLRVVAYRGFTDDRRGTVIQNRGNAASPHGPRGGVGPGGIGNYQVTAHRLSSTQAFIDLPQLRRGDRIEVVAGDVRYVYEVTKTRRVSFRSPASLGKQRAEVPGKPKRRRRSRLHHARPATRRSHRVPTDESLRRNGATRQRVRSDSSAGTE